MSSFSTKYREFIKAAQKSKQPFGFNLKRLAQLEPLFAFLFEDWWKVQVTGLDRLPKSGPALIVANSSALIPWTALMLAYALMSRKHSPRRLSILTDMDWVEDERLGGALHELGFVPWSAENMKSLFEAGELVVIFPEGLSGANKSFSERYRLREFDWTRLLPAIEAGVQIYPMGALGCEEAVPNVIPLELIRKWSGLPTFNITPFFPWFPFPLNFASFPVQWSIAISKHTHYGTPKNRDDLEEITKSHSRYVQGEIQAELNRLLRSRLKRRS